MSKASKTEEENPRGKSLALLTNTQEQALIGDILSALQINIARN